MRVLKGSGLTRAQRRPKTTALFPVQELEKLHYSISASPTDSADKQTSLKDVKHQK